MIVFAKNKSNLYYAIETSSAFDSATTSKLEWLLAGEILSSDDLDGVFIGPRKEMLTPWSTNAVEITQNMGVAGVSRIEMFRKVDNAEAPHDKMLEVVYAGLGQEVYTIDIEPEVIKYIDDIEAYNQEEGLALNVEEVNYLKKVSEKVGRKLTDSEVFGFSQVNSEHCRHKIFNGQFVIDGEEKELSLFKLIRKTSEKNPNLVVSAYKDNVSFVKGPKMDIFAPKTQNKADWFEPLEVQSVLSLKAETHNFPTTVEPFNGAATGAGGEIRDRIAGGKGSIPMGGTAVYMTAYSRLEEGRKWEAGMAERPWLYQTPMDILIKASNGASDFGNKFGQPLINGSVLTFEHQENGKKQGFDKVIMLAGGIGHGIEKDALKDKPQKGDKIVVMGGDNYRIGMGGSAVSSVDTGAMSSSIELNAIQRSNPEMQKRAYNALRALTESGVNPTVSIHDHGAGGHLNCLSELVEETGGKIDLDALPVGDPTLSAKEICGNESQERMGLVMKPEDIDTLREISERERAPFYVVGDITGDDQFTFQSSKTGETPIDLQIEDMFGNPPKTVMTDKTVDNTYAEVAYDADQLKGYIEGVLQFEAVACKDWLTNKVDRSVTGKVAHQQTQGSLQLPLSNYGAMALDFNGGAGIATAIGHAPVPSLVNEEAGSRLAIAESLTNLIFAPMSHGLYGVSLSANWMWPCKNEGEDARLYRAVEAVSEFACDLGINIPTGKDSLSMTQKYKDDVVYAPGTVIISASGEVSDVKKCVGPVLQKDTATSLIYIDLSSDSLELGGSVFGQVVNKLGTKTPDVKDTDHFKNAFDVVNDLVKEGLVLAGHDISEGGLITALLEMCFAENDLGLAINLDGLGEDDIVKCLFAENPAVLIQVKDADAVHERLMKAGIGGIILGSPVLKGELSIEHQKSVTVLDVAELRDTWYKTSYLLDKQQTAPALATERFENYKKQAIEFAAPAQFTGSFAQYGVGQKRAKSTGVKAAIIREKGVNGDREMAYSMWLAGFDVKDVHMTDLIAGREDLSDVNFIVFVGGFSNSDVLGSAKGWAGAFLYNEKAKQALDNFYAREDTLSLGVCNGCQLMVELGLVYPEHEQKPVMDHNASGKFESIFLNVDVPETNSVMLSSLAGSKLGIWVAHGEGKFNLPYEENEYSIALKYSQAGYPGNPNGSAFNTAGIVSKDGRHLAMMPHLERAIYPWQCGTYPTDRKSDECTPWLEAFVNARKWVAEFK